VNKLSRIERSTKKCSLEEEENRNARTMKGMITEFVHATIVIIRDGWRTSAAVFGNHFLIIHHRIGLTRHRRSSIFIHLYRERGISQARRK